MILEIIDEAAEDIVSIFKWYESKRPGLGNDFELCLDELFSRIIKNPEIYPEWHRKIRCALLTRFPYGIFYIKINDTIYIVAIFHLKRNPSKIKNSIKIRKF